MITVATIETKGYIFLTWYEQAYTGANGKEHDTIACMGIYKEVQERVKRGKRKGAVIYRRKELGYSLTVGH